MLLIGHLVCRLNFSNDESSRRRVFWDFSKKHESEAIFEKKDFLHRFKFESKIVTLMIFFLIQFHNICSSQSFPPSHQEPLKTLLSS